MKPLLELYSRDGLIEFELPPELRRLYGGGLGFGAPVLYANFVSSLDGVVALGEGAGSGSLISGQSEPDHFVMGLLRALADSVLVGAGTMRADRDHLWTPDYIYPRGRAVFAELRRRRGLPERPSLALLTASGEIDTTERALVDGAVVLTGERGASKLRGRLPAASVVEVLDGDPPPAGAAVRWLRARGDQAILCEGGPHLIGQLISGGLLDELFLTLSPVLAGRLRGDARLGLVEGAELLPLRELREELLSVRQHGSHLFLRYRLGASARPPNRR